MSGDDATPYVRVDFAVYRDVPVAGWPADVRALVNVGFCSLDDLDLQAMSPGERAFVIAQPDDPTKHVNPNMHAVSIAPYPHLVAKPEAPNG